MIKLGCLANVCYLAVNKIIQAQGNVVLCAVVEGGLEDFDDDEGQYQTQVYRSRTLFAADCPPPPPENKLGSLVVYHHGQGNVL